MPRFAPAPRPRAAAPRPDVSPRPGAPSPPTILLVDDDPAVRQGLARVLASEGWRVVSAASGAEALERLAEQPPDLLITDLHMAEITGWDLLFHETLHRPNLPIFVMTALPVSSVAGADHLAAEFFQKPLELEALVAAIRRRLEVTRPAQAAGTTTANAGGQPPGQSP